MNQYQTTITPNDFEYEYGRYEPYKCYDNSGIIFYYKRFIKKDGKPGKSWVLDCAVYFSHVRKCHWCGILGAAKKIQIRSFFGGRGQENTWIQEPCCMGCYNKIRPKDKLHWAIRGNDKLIRKLKRIRGIKL